MESYLQGQDLWEVGGSIETIPPARENVEALRQSCIKAGKAIFMLKITVEKQLLDHIREATTPNEAWDALVKYLFHEILKLDPESHISDTRMKRIIIRGLRPGYNRFMTAIREWHTQPTLLELESLLVNQDVGQTDGRYR
ncbi:hypothetical protein AMTRI_Chr03g141390 [Amborella trichopoda]